MRRVIVGLSALILLAAALPARACINDREVNRSEREFKSQYQQQPPASAPSPPPEDNRWSVAFLGGGAVLLLGATVTALNRRPRSRS